MTFGRWLVCAMILAFFIFGMTAAALGYPVGMVPAGMAILATGFVYALGYT